MRTELGESPVAFKIDQIGTRAQITFFENAVQLPSEEQPRWQADMYTLDVAARPGLTASIESNYQTWLDLAKAQEDVLPQKSVEDRVTTVEDVVIAIAEVLAYE